MMLLIYIFCLLKLVVSQDVINATEPLGYFNNTSDPRFNWGHLAYDIPVHVINILNDWGDFVSSLQQNLTTKVTLDGYIKHNCNGGETSFNYDASDGKRYSYWVGYVPWTRGPNCDILSRKDIVEKVLRFAQKEALKEDEQALCLSMNLAYSLHAHIRMKRWDEAKFYGQSSWDIPCP